MSTQKPPANSALFESTARLIQEVILIPVNLGCGAIGCIGCRGSVIIPFGVFLLILLSLWSFL